MEKSRHNNERRKVASGDQFRRWREEQQFSQKYLAAQLGVSPAAIQKMDAAGVSVTQALALAAIRNAIPPIEFNKDTP